MTKVQDAEILAEAYKNIINRSQQVEEAFDPNSIPSAIAHLIAGLSVAALYKLEQFIKEKREQKEAQPLNPGVSLDKEGNPAEPHEINAPISSSLNAAKQELNKGKTKI